MWGRHSCLMMMRYDANESPDLALGCFHTDPAYPRPGDEGDSSRRSLLHSPSKGNACAVNNPSCVDIRLMHLMTFDPFVAMHIVISFCRLRLSTPGQTKVRATSSTTMGDRSSLATFSTSLWYQKQHKGYRRNGVSWRVAVTSRSR